jgi:hypothetical protein
MASGVTMRRLILRLVLLASALGAAPLARAQAAPTVDGALNGAPQAATLHTSHVQQMQAALQATGTLEKTSASDKQELYENLAILGTYMALMREGLNRSPNETLAATMRSAARGYLQQALKLDPDRMQLTEQGLVVN